MAYSRRTPNYNLPQYENNDKPSYLQDFNGAMLSIDNALKSNSDNIGNLSNLTTTDKSSLVSAINEVASTPAGTTDYSDLSNKPSINNVTLSGNNSSSDLGIQDALVSGTNIKTINNTSILGSGNINVGGVQIIDLTNNNSSNPLILGDLEVGEYLLYFPNSSIFPATKTISIKYLSTHSSSESLTITSGATLKIVKKMADMTSNYDYMAYITQIYCTNNGKYKILMYNIGKTNTGYINISNVGNRFIPTTSTDASANKMLRTDSSSGIYWGDFSSIGSNYNSSAVQYLKNENGTLNWVTEANVADSVIYMGKINAYNSSANALDLSSYPAQTKIILKHHDSTRSFYLKVGSYTAEIPVTTNDDEAILNNTYYVDINSISGTTVKVSVVWASTYEFGTIVTNMVPVNFTSTGATVTATSRNLQGYTTFQIEEDASGNLNTSTLQKYINIVQTSFSKKQAPQRAMVQYIDKDKNNFILSYKSHIADSQQILEGTSILKIASSNGLYEAYRITLEINYTSGTYSSYNVTKTSLGYILNPSAITGYSATGTKTLGLNNGALEWV